MNEEAELPEYKPKKVCDKYGGGTPPINMKLPSAKIYA